MASLGKSYDLKEILQMRYLLWSMGGRGQGPQMTEDLLRTYMMAGVSYRDLVEHYGEPPSPEETTKKAWDRIDFMLGRGGMYEGSPAAGE